MNPENVCMHMFAEYLMSLCVKHWTSLAVNPGNRALYYLNPTVCRIIAFWAVFWGFGLLFYLLLGSRYSPVPQFQAYDS